MEIEDLANREFVNSPTEAHATMVALLHSTVIEAARRRQDELPGLVETLQDDVVLLAAGGRRSAAGWFAPGAWRFGNRQVHEVFLNADYPLDQPKASAEDVFVTLLHEACHAWARLNEVCDTSRDGRYHNRRFAEIALIIGLAVEKNTVIGHVTPGLSAWGWAEYADLLGDLERGLVLARQPQAVQAGSGADDTAGQDSASTTSPGVAEAAVSKYVFATCQCRDGRGRPVTIRVAKGSWRPEAIRCSICGEPFAPSL
jgi:hypothetical protein